MTLSKEKTQEEQNVEVISYLQELKEKAQAIKRTLKVQANAENTLGKNFKKEIDFLIFYQDDEQDPETINGKDARIFILENFKEGKSYTTRGELITDIIIEMKNLKPTRYVIAYEKSSGQWMS